MTIALAILRRYWMQIGLGLTIVALCVQVTYRGHRIDKLTEDLATANAAVRAWKDATALQNAAIDAVSAAAKERERVVAHALTVARSGRQAHEAASQRILSAKPVSNDACASAEALIDQYRATK